MVDYALQQQDQSTNNTCWAASTAMLLNYKGGAGWSDMAVVTDMQARFPDSVWDDGATELELGQVAAQYGFTQIAPACWNPEGWLQELEQNGPMLIQVPGNSHHSIVVAGIEVIGTADEEAAQASMDSRVHVHDPWYGERWLQYTQFEQEYELAGSNWANNVYRA
jgi:hypothetical protein